MKEKKRRGKKEGGKEAGALTRQLCVAKTAGHHHAIVICNARTTGHAIK